MIFSNKGNKMNKVGALTLGEVKTELRPHESSSVGSNVDFFGKLPDEMIFKIFNSMLSPIHIDEFDLKLRGFKDFCNHSLKIDRSREIKIKHESFRLIFLKLKNVNKVWRRVAHMMIKEVINSGLDVSEILFDKPDASIFFREFVQNITKLQLREGYYWNPTDLKNLLSRCPKILKLKIDRVPSNLHKYNVSFNTLSLDDTFKSTSLTTLKFSRLQLDEEGCQKINQCFPALKKLTCQSIDRRVDLNKHFTNLTSLVCGYEGKDFKGMVDCFFTYDDFSFPSVTSLKIKSTDLDAREIQKAMERLPNLTKLNIQDGQIGKVLNCLTLLPSTLEHLEIECFDAPTSFHHLIADKCPLLKYLGFHGGVDDYTPSDLNQAIGKIFSNCTQLIALKFNEYPNIGWAFDYVDQLPKLEFLDLSCSQLDDSQLKKVLSKCPNLTIFDVRETEVTKKFVKSMKTKNTKILISSSDSDCDNSDFDCDNSDSDCDNSGSDCDNTLIAMSSTL